MSKAGANRLIKYYCQTELYRDDFEVLRYIFATQYPQEAAEFEVELLTDPETLVGTDVAWFTARVLTKPTIHLGISRFCALLTLEDCSDIKALTIKALVDVLLEHRATGNDVVPKGLAVTLAELGGISPAPRQKVLHTVSFEPGKPRNPFFHEVEHRAGLSCHPLIRTYTLSSLSRSSLATIAQTIKRALGQVTIDASDARVAVEFSQKTWRNYLGVDSLTIRGTSEGDTLDIDGRGDTVTLRLSNQHNLVLLGLSEHADLVLARYGGRSNILGRIFSSSNAFAAAVIAMVAWLLQWALGGKDSWQVVNALSTACFLVIIGNRYFEKRSEAEPFAIYIEGRRRKTWLERYRRLIVVVGLAIFSAVISYFVNRGLEGARSLLIKWLA